MKKPFSLLVLLLIITLSVFSFAQEEGGMDQQAMMEAWQKSMTPGPMHELLAKRVGEWNAEVTMWMDPSQPPSTMESKTVCESMLGGRYFKSTHTGTMMGMPFEGYEINGYDNVKQKFFDFWIDNMGTGMMTSEGTYDEATKTFTYNGMMTDPMSGMDMNVKELIKITDNDTSTLEMYVDQGGQEMKTMEIKFTRIK
jgi:Protein of unknown function (DUF1579)